MAQNHRACNLFTGLKALSPKRVSLEENKVSAGLYSLQTVVGSSSFWELPTFLGLWLHHFSFGVHGYIDFFSFFLCQVSPCYPLVRTLVTEFMTYTDDLPTSRALTTSVKFLLSSEVLELEQEQIWCPHPVYQPMH